MPLTKSSSAAMAENDRKVKEEEEEEEGLVREKVSKLRIRLVPPTRILFSSVTESQPACHVNPHTQYLLNIVVTF